MNEVHTDEVYAAVRRRHHPQCVAYSPENDRGWQLRFTRGDDGSVSAVFDRDPKWEGYPNCLHGGVICTLLDAAMTNCLFARGKTAVTGRLTVRFLSPVMVDRIAVVRAWVMASKPPLHTMESELIQDSRVVARATAKFMEVPDAHLTEGSTR